MPRDPRNLARGGDHARGRGRVQRGAWEALVWHHGRAATAQVLDWIYADRRQKRPRGFRSAHVYWRLRRRLDEIADRIARASSPGRPWIYQLRPGWGPPGLWDTMYDERGEWMRGPDGRIITRDPDLVGVHPDRIWRLTLGKK